METPQMTALTTANDWPDTTAIDDEARRVLRRLVEPGACLAVAEGMEKAVIVREGEDGNTIRTGTVDSIIAESMALRDWIACTASGRVLRYRITTAGRTALKTLLAASENEKARASSDEDADERRGRPTVAESPLSMLARRRDRDGSRFLAPDMVRAGERLREEFEIASMGSVPEGGWEALLTASVPSDGSLRGAEGAQARLAAALADLGPGLGDIVLRVCCQLEGLESVEKRMGWAARSGKIVLRIALERLARHFERESVAGGGLIG